MTPPDELRAAARMLRDTGHGGWFLDVARWLERVARNWPSHLVVTSTSQAANERKDALGVARSIRTPSEVGNGRNEH